MHCDNVGAISYAVCGCTVHPASNALKVRVWLHGAPCIQRPQSEGALYYAHVRVYKYQQCSLNYIY